MLKIAFREPESEDPFQAICPWIDFITPEIILNKDGSMLAAFEYSGLDPDNLFDEQIDSVTQQTQRALSQLDKRLTGWWIVDKRRDTSYPENNFTNPVSAKLDKIYSKQFTDGKHYSITYRFYLLFTGNTGTDKFFDRVSRIQREAEVGLASSLFMAFKESLSGRNAFARDVGMLRENVTAFERIIVGLTNTMPLKMRRLEANEFTSALGALLNRATAPEELVKPNDAMLDSWLPSNYLKTGPDILRFTGNGNAVYASCLAIKKWPESTSPMLFETISKMDMELTICHIIRHLDSNESSAAINEATEYYNLTKYGLISHAIAQAGGREAEAKSGKAELLEQCKDAQTRIGAEGITYAYVNTSIFVYGASPQIVKQNTQMVAQRMSNMRFRVLRERMNTLASFAAMLPGQWALQTRWETLSVENVADTAPIYTMNEGSRSHEFFSREIYKQDVPKFAVFGNTYGGRFNFAPHVGQVGHMVIIAPTGGGKTTFVNFCLSQFQRYGDVNTFIFDRNYSCRIVTELHHGRHVDIKSKEAKWNPFFALKDGSPDGKSWVREWILRRLEEGGFVPTTEDRKQIDAKLTELVESGGDMSMSHFAALCPKNIEAELGEWMKDGPYGMFDSVDDDYSVSNWTTTEMREILAVDRLARAFMDYAFRKIYMSLDGRPTFIYLEEASFLLNNPKFRDMIDEWLKTLRKKNAFVWMTIQSPTSVTSSEISSSILDNIFSFLLLGNPKVESHRAAYREKFALEDHQIDMIAKLTPKRDYLLIQDTKAHVITTDFSKEVLAYLRSEEYVLAAFEKHRKPDSTDWHEDYLNYIAAH